jgi:hypothetical protein
MELTVARRSRSIHPSSNKAPKKIKQANIVQPPFSTIYKASKSIITKSNKETKQSKQGNKQRKNKESYT